VGEAKHQWRVDLNWLCGITPGQWMRLLRQNRVHARYLHRAALITVLSCYNGALAAAEATVYRGDALTPVRQPLFVLGHWRSGTTWLFQLLARDPRLAAPTAYQVVNPRTFRCSEAWGGRLFGSLIPARRLQDDVPLGFHLPEEDEYAIALLSGCSPYLGRSFPDRLGVYERFLTLAACTDAERDAFGAALRAFAGRVTAHTGRRLVLKSPAHTGRVRHLLRWFPDARFVHIHRDPYAVFASTRHLYDTVDWLWTLQRRGTDHDDTILRQYRQLHDAWFADRALIPPGRLFEVAYEALVADPAGCLAQLYGALDLGTPPDPAVGRPGPSCRIAGLPDYRPNRFPPLTSAERARVQQAAGPCFDAWGYAR
jgi:omega-hydroxy-beta-dihydromenaquinone-9 sulfotransferase